jgi:hypothetical protein
MFRLSSTGPLVYHAIRDVHPDTPILIFGGHSHIRDCRAFVCNILRASHLTMLSVQFDGRSMALESGRYMETVGTGIINHSFYAY